MPLTDLPNEILQTIANNLETESQTNRFLLTSREIYSRLNDWFYMRNIRQGSWGLFDAAYNGALDTAKRFLRLGADANAKGSHSDFSIVRTVLGAAVWSQHHDIAKLLLAYAADPNDRDTQGRTPLFYAAQLGNGPIVKLLLQWGADVNVYDFSCVPQSPLDVAFSAQDQSLEVVALLLEGGVDPDIVEGSLRAASSWSESSGEEYDED